MMMKVGMKSLHYMIILGCFLLLTGFALADDLYLIGFVVLQIMFGIYLVYKPTKFGPSVNIPVFVSAFIGILLTRPIYISEYVEKFIDVVLLLVILSGLAAFVFLQLEGQHLRRKIR